MIQKLILFSVLLLAVSCTPGVQIHAPDNSINSLCFEGKIQNTLISCITPMEKIASNVESEKALVLLIEPGDFTSQLATADESIRVVSSSIPSELQNIKPYLRQIFINLSAEHVRSLVEKYGSKYDHIYFFRSDVQWHPQSVSLALKNVLSLNKTVDLVLQVHGSAGSIALDSELQTRMTVADFKNMQNLLSATQRERVRSIFITACYSATAAIYNGVYSSISQSLVDLFPRATTYGNYGVNFAALQRDMVSFENYYVRDWDFYYSANQFANKILTRTIASNYTEVRTKLDYPKFSIKGQARYFGFSYTQNETISLPALSFPSHQHWQSQTMLFYGSASAQSTILTGLTDRMTETDLRKPSEYLAPSSCLYNHSFIPHGSNFSEYEYFMTGEGDSSTSVTVEFKVTCQDGLASRKQVLQPEVQREEQPYYNEGGY